MGGQREQVRACRQAPPEDRNQRRSGAKAAAAVVGFGRLCVRVCVFGGGGGGWGPAK